MPQPDGTGQRGQPKSFRVPPYYCLPFEGLHQEDIGLFSYHLYRSPLCFPPHQTLLAFFPSRRYLLPSMAIFPLSFINADVDPAEEYPYNEWIIKTDNVWTTISFLFWKLKRWKILFLEFC